MHLFLPSLCLFLISFILVWVIRARLLHQSILDIPNDRSSHNVPTPRGGGVAIVLSIFLGLAWLYHFHLLHEHIALALLGGGTLIAIIGWMDDVYSLSARWRALFHFIAAIWAVIWLKGFPGLNIGWTIIPLGYFGSIIGVLGIVWSINFYNFMDGIDGLAASEAIFVSAVASIFLFSMKSALAPICFLIVPASLGFLIWNWPRAKIFMGDVGSGFLGYIFAVLAIASENQHALPIISWIILLSVFIFDSTFTLISRIKRRQAIYAAHREHAYQRLIQIGCSHQNVTLSIILFNIFIVLPLTLISFLWPKLLMLSLVADIMTLLILWRKIILKAKIFSTHA